MTDMLLQPDVQHELAALRREIAEERAARHALEADLVASARQAGMAEVAASIIHNIGNVLTSVNISAITMAERLKRSELVHFQQLADLVTRHRDDWADYVGQDPQGRHLPDYLTRAAGSLLEERNLLLEELALLGRGIDHIKGILALQQRHAMADDMLIDTDPLELLDSAMSLNRAMIERCQVTVTLDAGGVQRHALPRHTILQILVNLVSNAIAAVRDLPEARRTIRLTAVEHADGLAFIVADTGIGIVPANIEQIFRRGYTTRHDGHGFGLHMSAIQAVAIQGRLEASSPGADQGATFTLHLPHQRSTPS
jgi:signal transduction histidine kinase